MEYLGEESMFSKEGEAYLLPQSILDVTFCFSSFSSSLGRVPERSWDRHSIRSYIMDCTCINRSFLLAYETGNNTQSPGPRVCGHLYDKLCQSQSSMFRGHGVSISPGPYPATKGLGGSLRHPHILPPAGPQRLPEMKVIIPFTSWLKKG